MNAIGVWPKKPRRCPHCQSGATPKACVVCNRDMCDDCISCDERGDVCGLCYDRHAGYARWEKYRSKGGKLDFDEWYDKNA